MSVAAPLTVVDRESRKWLRELRAEGATADRAVARLHELLLRAATFEVARRQAVMPDLRADAYDVAVEAADDALTGVRACLDDYRGESLFSTWAAKFALRATAVKLRRRAWEGRELPTAPVAMHLYVELRADAGAPDEQRKLMDILQEGVERLTPHERDILDALTVNEVPIDVLAERRGTTRGAVYETLRDARIKLRRHVEAAGPAVDWKATLPRSDRPSAPPLTSPQKR